MPKTTAHTCAALASSLGRFFFLLLLVGRMPNHNHSFHVFVRQKKKKNDGITLLISRMDARETLRFSFILNVHEQTHTLLAEFVFQESAGTFANHPSSFVFRRMAHIKWHFGKMIYYTQQRRATRDKNHTTTTTKAEINKCNTANKMNATDSGTWHNDNIEDIWCVMHGKKPNTIIMSRKACKI